MYVHTHIQTGSEYGALAEKLICLHFEVSWTTHSDTLLLVDYPRTVQGRQIPYSTALTEYAYTHLLSHPKYEASRGMGQRFLL